MSRTGKSAIKLPDGVEVDLSGAELSVKGPKGMLAMTLVDHVKVDLDERSLRVLPRGKDKISRSMWGMQRALINNLVEGVVNGYQKRLEMKGVGYRAAVKGRVLNLQLGFSHDINFPIPEGITINCPEQTVIEISGIDKQVVGQVAAEIRAYRKPEPYKGKGIKYEDEYIFRKEGKKK
jgi:large subunit ribosomal protein L6